VRALLQTTLQLKCPKLVERGLALAKSAKGGGLVPPI
jgi:hypothetical protein